MHDGHPVFGARSGGSTLLLEAASGNVHETECEANFHLEQEDSATDLGVVMQMVLVQQKQIAELSARVESLEQRKTRNLNPLSKWTNFLLKKHGKCERRTPYDVFVPF